MKKVVGVIGQGFVGGSLATVLVERGIDVYAHDISGKIAPGVYDGSRKKNGHSDLETLIEKLETPPESSNFKQFIGEGVGDRFSGIYFVCLPTPMFESGAADTSIVENTLKALASYPGERIAVVKSTVPPGSVERWNKTFGPQGLHVVFNPEFLREASAIDDMRNQTRIVLGGPRPWINVVKQLFEAAWPNVPMIKTSSTTAEMVKYVTNIHLAVKVSLANEFYQVCEALSDNGIDVDYDKVVEYALHDERLGTSHWKVPGPMPADDTKKAALGFSGSCFPKDINALMSVAKSLGVEPTVMKGAWEKNLEVRPQRDWEKLIGRAISHEKT